MTVSFESRLCFIIAMPTKYLQYKECIHSAVVLSACSYRRNHTRTNKENEKVYVESGSGDVAMVNMTENPSYMTTKEVLTTFTFNAEEDKADHTYEAIPF